jgi:hypothetical protein
MTSSYPLRSVVFWTSLYISLAFNTAAGPKATVSLKANGRVGFLENLFGTKTAANRFCEARELVKALIEEEHCFSSEAGARAFGEACAVNVVYEDSFEPQPFVGKMVRR